MRRSKHIHKYRRHLTTKGKPFWRCVLNGCTHVIYQEELMSGRDTLCWMCDEPMVIQNVQQAKPVCDDCKEHRKGILEKLRQIG